MLNKKCLWYFESEVDQVLLEVSCNPVSHKIPSPILHIQETETNLELPDFLGAFLNCPWLAQQDFIMALIILTPKPFVSQSQNWFHCTDSLPEPFNWCHGEVALVKQQGSAWDAAFTGNWFNTSAYGMESGRDSESENRWIKLSSFWTDNCYFNLYYFLHFKSVFFILFY